MFPIPLLRYRRTTHLLNGKPKNVSRKQEAVWLECYPVGNMVPFGYATAPVIYQKCNEYLIIIKSASRVGIVDVNDRLEKLVGASLIEKMWGYVAP